MKFIFSTFMVAAVWLVASSSMAAEQTTKLKVDGMYCASCPFIVKQTLADIDGVKDVEVSFREKMATVVYDDQTCSVPQLANAVSEAGFPATPVAK